MGTLLIFLLGAMAVSFLCSLLESVLMTTPISYITMREDEGDKFAPLFMKLKTDPDRPLAAILSLNTIANTIGAAGVGRQATILFGSEWFGLVSAIMTVLILVFSEIIPKSIGTSHWKGMLWLAAVMNALIYLLYPVVWLVQLLSRAVSSDEPDTTISREEVSAAGSGQTIIPAALRYNDAREMYVVGIGDSVMLSGLNALYEEFPNGYFDAVFGRTIYEGMNVLYILE